MAQADGVVANGTGSAVRSDINTQYAALWSNHSGSTEPSSGKVAYQFWADTNTNILKIRNSANNAWINLFTLAGGIDVDAASNFNEDVTFTGASYNLVWDKSDNALEFADNAKCTFGALPDLEIYHNGSHSYIDDSGTGALKVRSSSFQVQNADGSEYIINTDADDGVDLYFNGSKKFETTSSGVTVIGDVQIGDTSNHTKELRLADSTRVDASSIKVDNSTANLLITNDRGTGSIVFASNSAERFRLNQDGNICIGRTNNSVDTSNFGIALNNNGNITCARNVGSSGSQFSCWGNAGGLAIYGDGNAYNTNNSYGQISDETLKQDIVDAGSQWNDIKNIKVRKFRFKDNASGPLQIGVVAQEIETVSPGLVTEIIPDENKPDEEVKTVKYSVLYMKAIKALQEAMAKIETLETKVAALEAK